LTIVPKDSLNDIDPQKETHMQQRPNIVLITTDQQTFSMMSCAGNAYVSTPGMDSLAEDGVLFSRCYCANPVCMPSRFGLFTGRYPSEIGVRQNVDWGMAKLPEHIVADAYPQRMKRSGYALAYGGKEHIPYMNASALGFDYICKNKDQDKLADVCANYISSYDDENPFFLVCSFENPHDICLMAIGDFAEQTGIADKVTVKMFRRQREEIQRLRKPSGVASEDAFFDDVCPPLPQNHEIAPDEPGYISYLLNKRKFRKLAREQYSERDWRIHRWVYAQLTEKVDREIGKVLEAIRRKGIWDDTVILFTSDHGDMDASHKMEHKSCFYEEAGHVPFIVKGLSGRRGVQTEALVNNGVDLAATLLDYAGLDRPDDICGETLVSLIERGEPLERTVVFSECEGGDMATDGRYKYVRYFRGERGEQFYDLSVNPGELYNQIADESCRDDVRRLSDALDQQIAKQHALFLKNRTMKKRFYR